MAQAPAATRLSACPLNANTCNSNTMPSNSRPSRQRVVTSAAAAAAGGFADDHHHSGRLWSEPHSLARQLREFVAAQYLPIALMCALTLGATYPSLGQAAAKMHIPALATFGIFLVQGLQLKRKEAAAALTAKSKAYHRSGIERTAPSGLSTH